MKAKAIELVIAFESLEDTHDDAYIPVQVAKDCALICVDEILKGQFVQANTFNYWQEVKQEIKKL